MEPTEELRWTVQVGYRATGMLRVGDRSARAFKGPGRQHLGALLWLGLEVRSDARLSAGGSISWGFPKIRGPNMDQHSRTLITVLTRKARKTIRNLERQPIELRFMSPHASASTKRS